MNVDEIPRRGAKIDEKAPNQHSHCHRRTGLPRSMVKINVPSQTLPAVYSEPRVCSKPMERLGVLGH